MALFDLLGRSWSMGILWVLCENGPGTFRALQGLCENISPAVLNRRLKELQAAQLVMRGPSGYAATEMGTRVYNQLVPLGSTAKEWGKLLESKGK